MDDKKAPTVDSAQQTKPKRRFQYIGPAFQTGIYLPDMQTFVDPNTVTDADIEAYTKRWPKLLLNTWKEV